MTAIVPIKRALLSVSDKTDLVPFADRLIRYGVQLISTDGTATVLQKAGLQVTTVDQVTGFPEMLDGRVKTLHPKIHGGLLARRDKSDHLAALCSTGIELIDLVCVNLYPFEQTICREDVTVDEAIEQIDIGGPSMIRSAAKNQASVTVVTDPSQYDRVCYDIDKHQGATSPTLRQWLSLAAFSRTAAYDTAIAAWMMHHEPKVRDPAESDFPVTLTLKFNKQTNLRYGENPHQHGALYTNPILTGPSIARARKLQGKALSFCNLYDANGALELVNEVDADEHAATAVIKHANPCGFALANNLTEAFSRAYQGDPLAAFGGIVACNQPIDFTTAESITAVDSFFDVIVAPRFEEAAAQLLQQRWKHTRLLEVDPHRTIRTGDPNEFDFKLIRGGLLVQQSDLVPIDPQHWQHVGGPPPTDQALADARVATIAVKHIKSNAVCLVSDQSLVGAGAGQMDRLASCRIAVTKAGDRARGAVAGSDAFFPFRDGPEELIAAGVTAIVQPGGSKRDNETIDACNDAQVTLLFTGRRAFRH